MGVEILQFLCKNKNHLLQSYFHDQAYNMSIFFLNQITHSIKVFQEYIHLNSYHIQLIIDHIHYFEKLSNLQSYNYQIFINENHPNIPDCQNFPFININQQIQIVININESQIQQLITAQIYQTS